ncbi:MAG: MBL fold metallo-hydrolase [Deltaproteobacteria bacterium]|nr:MBL fold metallo-hydrolase [Deltaproteobacteria bacterium]
MTLRYAVVPMLVISSLFYPFLSLSGGPGMSLEEIVRGKKHHGKDGRFFNPWCPDCRRSTIEFLKWRFSKNPYREEKKNEAGFDAVRPDFSSLDNDTGRAGQLAGPAGPPAGHAGYAVWLGHATVFIKAGGKAIITDPVLWDISFFLKRKTPFPVEPERLPHIDYVLISHGHYDHLDTKSVRFLKERFDPVFITAPGYESYFKSIGVSKHIALDWWEEYADGDLRIRALPVQHWSKRGLFDTDTMLWASFLIGHGSKKYYWIGDSGYFEGLKEIGEKFGPMDVMFAPIGAYEPRWFMKTYHMNPEEALQAASDARAKVFIPIHWGTFDLTDEPLSQPLERLRGAYKEGNGPLALKILGHGGHIVVP